MADKQEPIAPSVAAIVSAYLGYRKGNPNDDFVNDIDLEKLVKKIKKALEG